MELLKEAGVFEVTGVHSWEAGKAEKTPTTWIDLYLETAKGVVKYRGFLTNATAEKTVETIHTLGFQGSGPDDFTSHNPRLFSVPAGTTVKVEREEKEAGKVYYNARYVNPPYVEKGSKKEQLDVANVLREAGFSSLKMAYNAKKEQQGSSVASTNFNEVPF